MAAVQRRVRLPFTPTRIRVTRNTSSKGNPSACRKHRQGGATQDRRPEQRARVAAGADGEKAVEDGLANPVPAKQESRRQPGSIANLGPGGVEGHVLQELGECDVVKDIRPGPAAVIVG